MRTVFILALVAVLSGCSVFERKTVTRPLKTSKGMGRLIDAKQRAIISVRRDVIGLDGQPLRDDKGERVTDLVICAEPSPDALQATATALGVEVGEKVLGALLNLSGSTAESAASIGLRTQTIQLLRDAYFRLCEGYLNDGLDAIAYDILQRRFQNQIVAVLAVEQLTGAVKAQQVALNTSAAANAGSQAALIARMLEDAEKELAQLEKERDENAADLKRLEKEKTERTEKVEAAKKELKAAEKEVEAAKTKLGKDSGNTDLEAALEQAETKLEQAKAALEQAESKLKATAVAFEAAKRTQSRLEEQIKRRQNLIKTLEEVFAAAVQATVKSSADGAATFGDAGGGSSGSSNADVANAVRAITLNAINQDYEAQVCFETLRFRNNLGQFRNDVNNAFDSAGLPERLEGGAFLAYCRSLFGAQADMRDARVGLVETYASAIHTIIGKVGKGAADISAEGAADLILALSEAVPTVPGEAFLKRTLEIGDTERRETNGDDVGDNAQKPGTRRTVPFLSGTVDIILPTTMTTDAEVGTPEVRLQCDDGKKPNDDNTACIERCAHKGVRYDKTLKECVAKQEEQPTYK